MAAVHPFRGFAEEFRSESQPIVAPDRFANALHLQVQDLARLAGVHRATVAESPQNAKLQGYLRDSLKALTAAYELSGDRSKAIYWFRNVPLPEYDHRTAEELVSMGRIDTVLKHITQLASGSSG
jgi:hypothetical protein